ncbi:hypothetical protein B0H17DRAFT_1156131 [Mycena rosella]|uniref:FAD/NAD(P)-binding domain-containing protein n=1 Tax=Mycena rosella TaxID=1033263 RepID=A0AAD7GXF8_MYCRO|nr:hypothetical protein B0H17DRAFT_1156131 [Mycena rosella]
MPPNSKSVAVLGAGATGLITAHTLSEDGFDVHVFTRDHTSGGQWAQEIIYPGLQLNKVYGEFSFSPLAMFSPPNSSTTGGRLTAHDLRKHMQEFADTLLPGKIVFETEILNVFRDKIDASWSISTRNRDTGVETTFKFAKVVLYTGGTSKPMIPDYLSPSVAAKEAHFTGPVIHSTPLTLVPSSNISWEQTKSIVVVGGGKSAQDPQQHPASQARDITVVMLSIISPHITLRTRLEYFPPRLSPNSPLARRFLHTTWLGNKLVHGDWNAIAADSFKTMGVPADSPLRLTYSPFWHMRTNDEGVPCADGFHALVTAGAIRVVAPARVVGYAEDAVLLNTGPAVNADLVVLATEDTAAELGLYRHHPIDQAAADEWKSYTTLANLPASHPDLANWSSSMYKGIVPSKNILRRDFVINGAVLTTNDGYGFDVAAHWISSYFLGDKMKLPKSPDEVVAHTERDATLLRKRYPDTDLA